MLALPRKTIESPPMDRWWVFNLHKKNIYLMFRFDFDAVIAWTNKLYGSSDDRLAVLRALKNDVIPQAKARTRHESPIISKLPMLLLEFFSRKLWIHKFSSIPSFNTRACNRELYVTHKLVKNFLRTTIIGRFQ